jgi:hypothetical protein
LASRQSLSRFLSFANKPKCWMKTLLFFSFLVVLCFFRLQTKSVFEAAGKWRVNRSKHRVWNKTWEDSLHSLLSRLLWSGEELLSGNCFLKTSSGYFECCS